MVDISTPANAFAIVGLADVVFRLGIASSELYFRYRNASESITRLLRDLKNLADIVALVRAFAEEYNRSPYALDDSQVLLPQLETALQCCKQELEGLEGIAKKVTSNASDAWFTQWGKGLSWALDDQKILKSCQQIERYMVTLNTALSLTGRRNDIVLRRELKAARTDVADAHASANANFSNLQQDVAVSSHAIEQGAQQISTAIQSSEQANATSFLQVEKSLASGHAKLGGINVAIDSRAKIINQNLSSVKKNLARGRREQGALLRQQKASNSKILNRLDDVCSTLTQHVATISLRETVNNEIFFEGENLDKMILPLMLMQTDLAKAVRTLVTEGAIKISRSEARWIEKEFQNLLVHGHEAAALALRSRDFKICTRRARQPGSVRTTKAALSASFHAASSTSNSRNQNLHRASTSKLHSAPHFKRRDQFYTAAGILVLETGTHDEEVHLADRSSSSSLAFRISFLPKLSLSTVGVTAAFSKQFGTGVEHKITRLVKTYNVIPSGSKAIICASENDVVGLQKLFASGKASPYDCDEGGVSLLHVAASWNALEAYMFLLREGANPLSTSAGKMNGYGLFWYMWNPFLDAYIGQVNNPDKRIPSALSEEGLIERLRRMTAAAVERNCDPNMVTTSKHESLLHHLIDLCTEPAILGPNLFHDLENLSEMVSSLLAMGCELESRDHCGRTPLLKACCKYQFNAVEILINKGADMIAVDDDRQSALHLLAQGSRFRKHDDQEQFRDALIAFLTNGCDPNGLCTILGVSPTEYCDDDDDEKWSAWTKALNHVGYTLLEPVKTSEMDAGSPWVVVSADFPDDPKLPISNLTLDDWKAERRKLKEPLRFEDCWKSLKMRI